MSDSICLSFRRLPHSNYAWMGGGVNIINIFVVSAHARKLRNADTQHPTNRPWPWGVWGSKVCLMTTLNHRPRKISSPLLLISSNDVAVG